MDVVFRERLRLQKPGDQGYTSRSQLFHTGGHNPSSDEANMVRVQHTVEKKCGTNKANDCCGTTSYTKTSKPTKHNSVSLLFLIALLRVLALLSLLRLIREEEISVGTRKLSHASAEVIIERAVLAVGQIKSGQPHIPIS